MAASTELSDYHLLAPYYDRVYGPHMNDRADEIELMAGIVKAFRPEADSILDLGTGTGAILEGFRYRLGTLVGLDLSPEMLEEARKNVPEAEFVEGDMSDFELGRQFDVVMSLFNAINHLPDKESWQNMFATTERHLKPGGIFMFDMVTTGMMKRLAERWRSSWRFPGGTYGYKIVETEPGCYTAEFKLKTLGPGNQATTIQGDIHETVHGVEEVKEMAAKHFELVRDFNVRVPDMRAGLRERATDDSSSAMFIFRKPA
jgi:SAM-dependent methyltransferase